MTSSNITGAKSVLYVVATPIGNLSDISQRAIEILKAVDWIACEDTRHSARLLDHLNMRVPLISLHAHNEHDKSQAFIDKLLSGQKGALISDAGTPLISDPGFILVKLARENNIDVIPIPGPCAMIAALSVSGLKCSSFQFIGFLPAKSKARQTVLDELAQVPQTLIFYESPHRIEECLADMQKCLGKDTKAFIAREMTKKFESYYHGTLEQLSEQLRLGTLNVLGEFVVITEGKDKDEQSSHADLSTDKIIRVLLEELPINQVSSLVAKMTGESKRDIYQRALKIKG